MVAASLLTTLLLALAIAIAAKPVLERKSPIKLPLTKRRSLANYNVVERDRRRVKSLRRRAGNQVNSGSISTVALFQRNEYTIPIGIGNPAMFYDLVLDSGSSNIWVGANKTYVQTSTSQQTHNQMGVDYGSGSFLGNEFTDQVTIGSGLVIANQPIGVALQLTGFFGVGIDGIIGIGPTDRTIGSLSPDRSSTIPTVTDSLFASGVIHEHLVAVAFQPFNKSNSNNPGDIILSGEVNWGGIDTSLFIGNIAFAPITSNPGANTLWGIDASVTYGTTALPSITAGVVDTATTLFNLAPDAFNAYKAATGAVLDVSTGTGLLTITSTQFKQLQGLSITISGVTFTLPPDAQIMPQYLNTVMGGVANQIYLIVGDIGTAIGGPSFILGTTVLERFYCVFDTANKQVGLANTPFTNANLNLN